MKGKKGTLVLVLQVPAVLTGVRGQHVCQLFTIFCLSPPCKGGDMYLKILYKKKGPVKITLSLKLGPKNARKFNKKCGIDPFFDLP